MARRLLMSRSSVIGRLRIVRAERVLRAPDDRLRGVLRSPDRRGNVADGQPIDVAEHERSPLDRRDVTEGRDDRLPLVVGRLDARFERGDLSNDKTQLATLLSIDCAE